MAGNDFFTNSTPAQDTQALRAFDKLAIKQASVQDATRRKAQELQQQVQNHEQFRREQLIANTSRSGGEIVQDTATMLGVGAGVRLPQIGYGVADLATRALSGGETSLDEITGGFSQKFDQAAERIKHAGLSETAQVQEELAGRRIQEYDQSVADNDKPVSNFFGGIAAAASAYADNPVAAINAAIESVPQMLTGGVAAKGATKLAAKSVQRDAARSFSKLQPDLTTAAIRNASQKSAANYMQSKAGKEAMEKLGERVGVANVALTESMSNAVSAKGEVLGLTEEDLSSGSPVYNQLRESGMSHEEARMEVSKKVFDATAALTAVTAGAAAKVTGAGKFEGNLFNKNSRLGQMFLTRVAKGGYKGTVAEAPEEAIQGGAGQLSQNIATKEYVNKDQELGEGVGTATGAGAVIGGLSGAAIGTATSIPGAAKNSAVNALTKAVKKQAEKAEVKKQAAVTESLKPSSRVEDAVKAGNIDNLYDNSRKDFNPIDAADALIHKDILKKETVTEQGKHLDAADNIINDAANAAVKLHTELTKKEGATKEEIASSKSNIVRLNNKFQDTKKRITALREGLAPETQKELDTAVATINKNEDTPEAKKAVDTVADSFYNSYSSFDKAREAAEAIVNSTKATEPQKTLARNRIITLSKLNDLEGVKSDIFEGRDGFMGIKQHQQAINDHVKSADVQKATDSLNAFTKFAADRQESLKAFEEGMAIQAIDPKKRTEKQRARIKKVMKENKFTHFPKKGEQNAFHDTKIKEVEALKAAVQESIVSQDSVFGGKLKLNTKALNKLGAKTDDSAASGASQEDVAAARFANVKTPSKDQKTHTLTEPTKTKMSRGKVRAGEGTADVTTGSISSNFTKIRKAKSLDPEQSQELLTNLYRKHFEENPAELQSLREEAAGSVFKDTYAEITRGKQPEKKKGQKYADKAPVTGEFGNVAQAIATVLNENVSNTPTTEQQKIVDGIDAINASDARKEVKGEKQLPSHIQRAKVKARVATQFIGEGVKDSSTDLYRNLYASDDAAVNKANTGNYSKNDTVFVAANATTSVEDTKGDFVNTAVSPVENPDNLTPDALVRQARGVDGLNNGKALVLKGAYENVALAVDAKANIIMDTQNRIEDEYSGTDSAGAKLIAAYLKQNNYVQADGSGLKTGSARSGLWIHQSKVPENQAAFELANKPVEVVQGTETKTVKPVPGNKPAATVTEVVEDSPAEVQFKETKKGLYALMKAFPKHSATKELRETGLTLSPARIGRMYTILDSAKTAQREELAKKPTGNRDLDHLVRQTINNLINSPTVLEVQEAKANGTLDKQAIADFTATLQGELAEQVQKARVDTASNLNPVAIPQNYNIANSVTKNAVNTSTRSTASGRAARGNVEATEQYTSTEEGVNNAIDTIYETDANNEETNLLRTVPNLFNTLDSNLDILDNLANGKDAQGEEKSKGLSPAQLVALPTLRTFHNDFVDQVHGNAEKGIKPLLKVKDSQFLLRDQLQLLIQNYKTPETLGQSTFDELTRLEKIIQDSEAARIVLEDATDVATARTGQDYKNLNKLLKETRASLATILADIPTEKLLDENIVSMMAVTALNWLTTDGIKSIRNSDDAVNAILGKTRGSEVHPDASTFFETAGTVRTTVIRSVGKAIRQQIGLGAKSDTDGALEAKLEISLGNMAVASLESMGILIRENIPSADIDVFRNDNDEAGNVVTNTESNAIQAKKDNSDVSFVRLATKVAEKELSDGTIKEVLEPIDSSLDIINTMKGSDKLLSKLFDLPTREVNPTLEPAKSSKVLETDADGNPTKLDNPRMISAKGFGSAQEMAPRQQVIQEKAEQTPNRLKTNVLKAYDYLPVDMQEEAYGLDRDYETKSHKRNHASIRGRNQDIEFSVEDLATYRTWLRENGKNGELSDFFFPGFLPSNTRMMQSPNTVNTQMNKLHRHVMGLVTHIIQVDPSNKDDMDQFKLAVAESLGIGVDKLNIQKGLNELDALLSPRENDFIEEGKVNEKKYEKAKKKAKAIQGAVDIIVSIENGTVKENDPDTQKALLAGIVAGGERIYSLDGISALAAMQAANGKPFESNLFREVDGVTNGVIIGLTQLAAAGDFKTMLEMLERGALYADGTYDSFSSFVANPNKKDAYQDVAVAWQVELNTLAAEESAPDPGKERTLGKISKMNSIAALTFFVEPLSTKKTIIEDGKEKDIDVATKAGRDMAKYPLMIANYGGSLARITTQFSEDVYNSIFEKIEKAVALAESKSPKEAQEALDAVHTQLSLILPIKWDKKTSTFKENAALPALELATALEYTLAPSVEEAIKKRIKYTYGQALRNTIESKYSHFMDKRTELNNSLKTTYLAFKMVYDDKVRNLAIEDFKRLNPKFKGDDTEVARQVDAGRAREPSPDQLKAIAAELIEMQPVYKAFFSVGKKDSIQTMKTDAEVQVGNPKYLTVTDFGKELPVGVAKKDANGKVIRDAHNRVDLDFSKKAPKQSQVWASKMDYIDPGLGGAILGIHGIDSAVSALTQELHDVLNVFDAFGFATNDLIEGSLASNKAFKDVAMNYSMRAEILSTLEGSMAALAKYDEDNDTNFYKQLGKRMAVESKFESTATSAKTKLEDEQNGYIGFTFNGLVPIRNYDNQYRINKATVPNKIFERGKMVIDGTKVMKDIRPALEEGQEHDYIAMFIQDFKDTTEADEIFRQAIMERITDWGQYSAGGPESVHTVNAKAIEDLLENTPEKQAQDIVDSVLEAVNAQEIQSHAEAWLSKPKRLKADGTLSKAAANSAFYKKNYEAIHTLIQERAEGIGSDKKMQEYARTALADFASMEGMTLAMKNIIVEFIVAVEGSLDFNMIGDKVRASVASFTPGNSLKDTHDRNGGFISKLVNSLSEAYPSSDKFRDDYAPVTLESARKSARTKKVEEVVPVVPAKEVTKETVRTFLGIHYKDQEAKEAKAKADKNIRAENDANSMKRSVKNIGLRVKRRPELDLKTDVAAAISKAPLSDNKVHPERDYGVISGWLKNEFNLDNDFNQRPPQQEPPESIGSSFHGIDVNNFKAEFTDTLSSGNILTIFEKLARAGNVTDSVEHSNHLGGLLGGIISKVINPYEATLSRRSGGLTTEGQLTGSGIYMVTGLGNQSISTNMSARETYVHELIHLVTRTAVDSKSWASDELKKLYETVRDAKDSNGNPVINAKSFLRNGVLTTDNDYAAELAIAQERYDYIFGDKIATRTRKYTDAFGQEQEHVLSNAHHEFLAIGLTNEAFINAISSIQGTKKVKTDKNESIFSRITTFFNNVLNWFGSRITNSNEQTADKKLETLFAQLAGFDYKEQNKLSKSRKGEAIVNNVAAKSINAALKGVTAPVEFIGKKAFGSDSKSVVRRSIGNAVRKSQYITWDSTWQGWDKATQNWGKTKDLLNGVLLNEVKGRVASNTYLHNLGRMSSMYIDQARRNTINFVVDSLGTIHDPLSDGEKDSYTKAAFKTDLEIFGASGREADGNFRKAIYTKEEMSKLMDKNSELVQKGIDLRVKKLRKFETKQAEWYVRMAINLGEDMANGIPRESFTLKNATVIAQGVGTGLTWNENDIKAAIPLIDELASLQAIKKTPDRFKRDLKAVIDRENKKDDSKNGFLFTLATHRRVKEKAKEKLFQDEGSLLAKGYTKEIFDPNISYRVAPADKEEELNKLGYSLSHGVVKDSDDPNQRPLFMYVSRDGLTRPYMSGIASFTSDVAAGTSIMQAHGQYGDVEPSVSAGIDFDVVHSKKEQAIQDILNGKPPAKADGNISLIPVLNPNNEIVNYRYMMSELNKDEFLGKNNRYDEVLGGMEANVDDKVATELINNKLIDDLFDDHAKNKSKHFGGFTEIGPDVKDQRWKEVYQMLPWDARKRMNEVWDNGKMLPNGTKGPSSMFVPTNVVDMVFGFRKIGVAGLRKIDRSDKTGLGQVAPIINNMAAAVLNTGPVRFAEQLWQETIKMVKDAIVIKSGIVLGGNFASNMLILKVLGVPMSDIIADHTRGIAYARQYQKDKAEIDKLTRELELIPGSNKSLIKGKIKVLKDKLYHNPVRDLIEEGIHQSIVEDVELIDERYSYKSKAADKIGATRAGQFFENKVPKGVKVVAKELVMTHDSSTYKFLRDSTQLSDFAARYVLHKHNTKTLKMDPKASINMIIDTFINYDLPTHPYLQYANDMGLFMFSKFFIRIQRVLAYSIRNKTGNFLALAGLQDISEINIPDIFDSWGLSLDNIMNKFNDNPWELMMEIMNAPAITGAVNG